MQRRTQRAVVGSFAVLVAVTAVGFALTEAGHLAYLERDEVIGEVVDYRTAGQQSIEVTVRIENPTPRGITVTVAREFDAFLAGQRVATVGITDYRPQSIPPDGTVTRTVTLVATDEGESRWRAVRAAVESRTLTATGVFSARIGEKPIAIEVPEGAPDAA